MLPFSSLSETIISINTLQTTASPCVPAHNFFYLRLQTFCSSELISWGCAKPFRQQEQLSDERQQSAAACATAAAFHGGAQPVHARVHRDTDDGPGGYNNTGRGGGDSCPVVWREAFWRQRRPWHWRLGGKQVQELHWWRASTSATTTPATTGATQASWRTGEEVTRLGNIIGLLVVVTSITVCVNVDWWAAADGKEKRHHTEAGSCFLSFFLVMDVGWKDFMDLWACSCNLWVVFADFSCSIFDQSLLEHKTISSLSDVYSFSHENLRSLKRWWLVTLHSDERR